MVTGAGQPVAAVVDLSTGADGVERLRVLANSPIAVG